MKFKDVAHFIERILDDEYGAPIEAGLVFGTDMISYVADVDTSLSDEERGEIYHAVAMIVRAAYPIEHELDEKDEAMRTIYWWLESLRLMKYRVANKYRPDFVVGLQKVAITLWWAIYCKKTYTLWDMTTINILSYLYDVELAHVTITNPSHGCTGEEYED